MEHKESIRISEHATKAVVFVHGILGTPNHFAEFVSRVPLSVSVYNILLDGHGKGVKDFAKTSMKNWESQVTAVVEGLATTHEKLYIVAHSLGTLLAIEQAVKNPKVCGLFLLAAPLRLSLKWQLPVNSFKVYMDRIDPDDPVVCAAKTCYGIANDKNPFHYLGWIPRFLELFTKIRQTRVILPNLHTPCRIYQSQRDEIVSPKSVNDCMKIPNASVKVLKNSGHYYYEPSDRAELIVEFEKMIGMDGQTET